jgi:copper resistance protein B
LLYSRAVAPFWDAQIGLRHDLEPNPSRTWLAAGFMGVAPYHFETDATLYVGEDSRTALEVTTHYEFLFTQKLILAPELALTAYGKDDLQRGLGSGLSDTELGLRLRYEIRREFAPYIGVHWAKKYGETADMARQDGEKVSSTKLIAGLRFWY